MRPRTKLQLRVVGFSKALPVLTQQQKDWAFKHCLKHKAYRTRLKTHCLDCGHTWATPNNSTLLSILGDTHVTCPACGRKLQVEDTRKKIDTQKAYLGKVSVVEEFQLSRFYEIHVHYRAGTYPNIYIREVAQIWHNPFGKSEVIGRNISGYAGYFCGDMEIRDRKRINREYSLWPHAVLPGARVLPVYKRNGFKGKFHGVGPHDLLTTLMTDTKAETLLKAGQIELLRGRCGERYHDISQYWDAIKICMRNKYIVKEGIIYLDYLKLLNYFKKDLHSAKYVCPKDLKAQHNKLVAKKRSIDEHNDNKQAYANITRQLRLEQDTAIIDKPVPLQIELTRLRALQNERQAQEILDRDKKAIEQFEKRYAKFADMSFKNGDLVIVVLQSINEFKTEGDVLKHCVFTNGYYKKENSLVLSARIDGKPIETIEITLDNLQIVQARGLGNATTKYHQQIINLVTNNLSEVRKRLKPRKTRKMNQQLLQTA